MVRARPQLSRDPLGGAVGVQVTRGFIDSVAWSIARTIGLLWAALGFAAVLYPELAQDSTAPSNGPSPLPGVLVFALSLTFLLPLSGLSRKPVLWLATVWYAALLVLSIPLLRAAVVGTNGLTELLGSCLLALLLFVAPPLSMLWLLHSKRLRFAGQARGAA